MQNSSFTEVAKCHGENNVVADVDIVVVTGALFEKDGWDKESIRARQSCDLDPRWSDSEYLEIGYC